MMTPEANQLTGVDVVDILIISIVYVHFRRFKGKFILLFVSVQVFNIKVTLRFSHGEIVTLVRHSFGHNPSNKGCTRPN
jgi:hypothetical protein